MTVKFSNNASATLATGINTSATTIQVTAGQGTQFPALGVGDYFYATIFDSSNNIEVVKVTQRSSDALTVVRAQEGTVARAYVAGDKIDLRLTAGGLTDILTDAKAYSDASAGGMINAHINDTEDAHDASAIGNVPSGSISGTNVQAAINELDSEKVAKTTTITGQSGITATGDLTNGVVLSPTANYNGHGVRTVSTNPPSGGSDGDIWYQV